MSVARPVWLRVRDALLSVNELGVGIGAWPSERAATIFNTSFVLLWSTLVASVLVRTGHFTYDQAFFYELAMRVAETWTLPAYGPFVSGVEGPPQTPGGLMYVLYSVPFFFAKDPRFGMAWIHLLQAAGSLLFDRALKRLGIPPAMRIATVVLFVASTTHTRLSETLWNGNLFLFITPVLLYLAARMVAESQSEGKEKLWPCIAFGVTAALSLQTHISGGMGVVMCLAAAVLFRSRPLSLRSWAAIGLTFAACYLPYLYREVLEDFRNYKLLRQAVPASHFNRDPFVRSLLSSVIYPSHAEMPQQMLAFGPAWEQWVYALSGWVAVALCGVGLAVRFPLKLWVVFLLIGLPTNFLLNSRPYYDHYVATVIPFACLLAGAGMGFLLARARATRIAGAAYLGLYMAAGLAVLFTQLYRPILGPQNPWRGMTVAYQIDRTREALAAGRPIPSGYMDELALVKSIVAKRIFNQELYFSVAGLVCTADIRWSGFAPPDRTGALILPLANNGVFVCRR